MSGLFGSTILEVAIGLIVVYFLLSTICSAIQETLAGFLKLRARDLERGIENMLCDGDLAQAVLTHPLIKSLGSTRTETVFVKRGSHAGKPSYIPAQIFTTALFDSLPSATSDVTAATLPGTVADIRRRADALARDGDANKQSIGKALLSLIDQSQSPTELARQIGRVKQAVAAVSETGGVETAVLEKIKAATTIQEIRAAIAAIGPDSPARPLVDAVARAIDVTQADLQALRTRVEGWYDDVMDRVSGIYKRRVQWWLLVIALVVTVLVGADTLRIVNTLATSATLRAVLVADASQLANSNGQPPPDLAKINDELPALNQLFGYNGGIPPVGEWFRWQTVQGWFDWAAARTLLGLLLTAFAVSLGAPFWFDLLNKFVNIRAAGTLPDKAGATGSAQATP